MNTTAPELLISAQTCTAAASVAPQAAPISALQRVVSTPGRAAPRDAAQAGR